MVVKKDAQGKKAEFLKVEGPLSMRRLTTEGARHVEDLTPVEFMSICTELTHLSWVSDFGTKGGAEAMESYLKEGVWPNLTRFRLKIGSDRCLTTVIEARNPIGIEELTASESSFEKSPGDPFERLRHIECRWRR